MSDTRRTFRVDETVIVRDWVKVWAGRSGLVRKLAEDGQCLVQFSPAASLWFEPVELRHHPGAPVMTRSDFT